MGSATALGYSMHMHCIMFARLLDEENYVIRLNYIGY